MDRMSANLPISFAISPASIPKSETIQQQIFLSDCNLYYMVSINRDSLRAIPAYKTQLRHVKKKQGTAYLPPTILGCWTIVEKLF